MLARRVNNFGHSFWIVPCVCECLSAAKVSRHAVAEHVFESLRSSVVLLPVFVVQVHNSSRIKTDCLVITGVSVFTTSVILFCAQIEKCSQVFPWCLQNRFKSCHCLTPSTKVLRFFESIHTSSVGVVPLVISHRARLVNSAKNSSCAISIWSSRIRAL